MYQKFFSDTIVSRFIKRLLRCSAIPHYETYRQDSDPPIPGTFLNPETNMVVDVNVDTRSITSVKRISEQDINVFYNFHSNIAYYDPETHYHLGRYLRYLRDFKNQNLMPFYNCFNYKVVEGFTFTTINENGYIEGTSPNYKYLAVPVRFNQTYTIALQSSLPFYYGYILYGEHGLINGFDDGKSITNVNKVNYSRFKDLWEITTPAAQSTKELSSEKFLYLVFQIPVSNNSSFVVLEGSFINSMPSFAGYLPVMNFENVSIYKNNFAFNLELLKHNDGVSYPFSDKLIEYLLLNVIDANDEITDNAYIANTNNLGNYNVDNDPDARMGKFTDMQRSCITLKLKDLLEKHLTDISDIDGNIDSKVEQLLMNNYLAYQEGGEQ